MTIDINFIDLLNVMIRKWWLIVVMMIAFGTGSYIYTSLFIQPMYSTDGTIYVNCETEMSQIQSVASVSRLDSNSRLAETYAEVLKSRSFLEEVSRDMNNKYSSGAIGGMLKISPVNNTEILKISVTCIDAEDACAIVKSILNRAGDQLVNIVRAGSVEVVDEPYVPGAPSSPNKSKNVMVGMIAGAIIAVVAIFLMELFDTHVKSAEELRQRYEEPILGEIPSLTVE